MKQDCDACDEKNRQCIDQSLRNDCSQRLGKRDVIIFRQDPAAAHFPDPGNYQTGGIRNEDSIHAIALFRESVQRFQCLPPPPSTKDLREHPPNTNEKSIHHQFVPCNNTSPAFVKSKSRYTQNKIKPPKTTGNISFSVFFNSFFILNSSLASLTHHLFFNK